MQKTLDHYGAGIVDAAGAVAEGRSAAAGDRRLPRRAGRARRPRALSNEAQTYANRVVPEARGNVAQITQAAEAYRVADRGGSDRPDLALPEDLRAVQEGARRDARAHVSGDDGARARRHRQDHRRSGRRRHAASCPICRSTSFDRQSSRRRASPPQPRRREAANETQCSSAASSPFSLVAALIVGYGRRCSPSIRPSRRWCVRLGKPVRVGQRARACTSRRRSSTT